MEGAAEQSEFLFVEHQAGLDGMGVIFLHEIDKLRRNVADRRAFIGHVLNGHVGGHRDMFVLVLQNVIVAVEFACNTWQVGYDGSNLSEVNAVQSEGQVL